MADIRGDLHCHTTLSDGKNTLEEMAEAARGRGYSYLAITDHSSGVGMAGLQPLHFGMAFPVAGIFAMSIALSAVTTT